MNKYIILLIIIIFVSVFLLTGCYDSREIEELAYVLAMGIDEGTDNKYRITVQFPTLEGAPGSEEDNDTGEEGYTTISFEAPSFAAGIDIANAFLPRSLNFMHTKFIIISDELAKKDISELIMSLVRYREIRKTANVIIAEDSAEDFLKENKTTIGTTLSKTMELLMNGSFNTGYFPNATLHDFHNSIHSNYEQSIAIKGAVNELTNNEEDNDNDNDNSNDNDYKGRINTGGKYVAGEIPREGGSKIELFGTTVFKWSNKVGELTGDETRILLITRGEFQKGIFAIKDLDEHDCDCTISLEIHQEKKPDISVSFKDGQPNIRLDILLEGELAAVDSMKDYSTPEEKDHVEKAFENFIKRETYKLFDKCKDMEADIFRFGTIVAKKFNTIQEWEDYNWLNKFRNSEIDVNVKFYIRRTGNII
ncbi:MAG TPA: Ger(x)C family spore germination protein [Thermoanaerobacterales bacterium]|nr:Ger(x)C family spore germination protein [Thermoanaerobacterales bacterium]